ncbi:MAG: YggS family pyridoxal phosphate-dependent enzyme [Chloroflexota bacterium]
MISASGIRDSVDRVLGKIEDAAARSGRSARDVKLVAVTKTQPPDVVAEAASRGLRVFGENRVQEAERKIPAVQTLVGEIPLEWRLIGTLQRNKVNAALPLFSAIDSVDNVRVAQAINDRAPAAGYPVLLEVYLGVDPERPGFTPVTLRDAVERLRQMDRLRVQGLMTIAPLGLTPDATREAFRELRRLSEELRGKHRDWLGNELSMGMTNDYEIAIEEGATLVRVGRALFGERPQ